MSARIIKYYQWDITAFLLAVQMMNFRGTARGDALDTKYVYVTHSELNAILNYRGGSLEGAKLYVSMFPCNECAKAIIQSGIKEIIYGVDKYPDSPPVIASKRMLNAAGVRYRRYVPTGGKFVCMYEGGVPMAYYVLENDCLKVTAADMGAELASIYDKEKQREYLWNGDEKILAAPGSGAFSGGGKPEKPAVCF